MPASLSPEVRERLAKALRERVLPQFGPDIARAQTRAAAKLQINQSTISRLMDPKKPQGGSLTLIELIADFLGEPPEKILFGAVGTERVVRQFRELPGFAEAMTKALERVEEESLGITPFSLEQAANTRSSPEPARITPGLLIQTALAARKLTPDSKVHHRRPRRRT